ncbi:glutamine synthetase family protein [Thermoflavimicrobium daqui]|jgi:glutamine synthetase|uniref:Glutamine synthetase n=1 Tax=Thermoflavimicrobium daqui TaxID=2137476 RepID=A0A364K2H5_9BACL|nr:glutamine synthetase family protein [Thermoflavimicrobium daqui]RAL22509.1 glutamine synthetase [Thermoflavimicrobium daqui]
MCDQPMGKISKADLHACLQNGVIDTLIIAICDMQGRLMGKRLTREFLLSQDLDHGTHFCNYLLGTDMEMTTPEGYQHMNWNQGYGDWLAKPDWSTLRIIPWLEKTAMVLADSVDEKTGELIEIAPRTILRKQLKRASSLGYQLHMASELEFYLLKDSYEEVHQKGYEHICLAGHYNEDYNLLQGTRNEPIYAKMRKYMNQSGILIESSKGEAYTGQHEMNISYSEALSSADHHVLFKHGLKEIALQEGVAITFMAKPDHRWTGSSGHIHLSLWDQEGTKNLFDDPKRTQPQMSEKMRFFLGGLLKYTRDFSLFLAPNVNSYKRYAPESWAPVNIVWSYDNRSTGFRIVGKGSGLRIENRIPGADINPYLAYAAMIGTGLKGIEKQIEPTEEFKGNAYQAQNVPRIPASLAEAIHCWANSEIVDEILGEHVARHYELTARNEQQLYDRIVTSWERARYFEQG